MRKGVKKETKQLIRERETELKEREGVKRRQRGS